MYFKQNVKKTYIALLSLVLLLITNACDDGLNDIGELGDTIKTSGFVINGFTASGSRLVKYFEDVPSGIANISDGTDFSEFFVNGVVDNAMFLARPDGNPGFSKIVVGDDERFYEVGTLPALSVGSFRIDVRDSEYGVFQDRATSDNITVFNPTTMQIIGGINMSQGEVPGDIEQRYQRFIFRGDDVFAPIRGNISGESFTSAIYHQGNIVTQSYVGTTERQGNGFATIESFNNFGQNLVDNAGNLYLADAGNYTGLGVAAAIARVNAGSNEIDPSYVFEPARILNPFNTFLPTMNGFTLMPNSNGMAIAKVNATTPQEAVDIVLSVGGNLALLTDSQIAQIFNILFTAESAFWCVLDVNNRTVVPIQGIPAVGVFAVSDVFFHGDEVFIPVATSAENGYYRYNPTTGQASKAFEVVGADISQVINLSNNN
jgi:hypothetical protein